MGYYKGRIGKPIIASGWTNCVRSMGIQYEARNKLSGNNSIGEITVCFGEQHATLKEEGDRGTVRPMRSRR